MYLPKLSAQAQKFGISLKKRLHWASVVRGTVYACVHQLISQEFITEFIAKSWQKLIDFQALQKLDTGVK